MRANLTGRIAACTLLAVAATAAAGTQADRARELVRLSREVHQLFQRGDFEKAAVTCRTMIGLSPGHPSPHYNLACALARLGRKTEALAALEMAVIKGFRPADHIRKDDDLASIRGEPRFAKALAKARENERMTGAVFEPGARIPGVKTLEGAPEGGLRYRLRMSPAATAQQPSRLLVWLHPAGGSANRVVEPMAPRFIKAGFALLVFTQKEWRFWSGADAQKLVNATLPAVAKIPGIDARRPILMGYSAGGQAGLMLWAARPGSFGGLILDAAYPVRRTPKGYAAMPLPADPAARRTPFFVLVGDKDPGARVWRKLEPVWRKAGVPLTIRYIPGKGHAWLVGPKQLEELAAWLEQIKAGKTPGAPQPSPPLESL